MAAPERNLEISPIPVKPFGSRERVEEMTSEEMRARKIQRLHRPLIVTSKDIAVGRKILTREAILQRVDEMAQGLTEIYKGKRLLVVAITTGAMRFADDLTQ